MLVQETIDWLAIKPGGLYVDATVGLGGHAIEIVRRLGAGGQLVGMDRDAVLSAKGSPDRRVREVRDGAEQEDWIYGTPPHVLFITFDGDQVVSVKQF